MIKDEAMKMALEALKDNQHLVADNERHAYVMEYNSIIEKLEEALAKQEQSEPVSADDFFQMIADKNPNPFPAYKRKPFDLASAIEYADARWAGVDVPVEWLRHFVDGLNGIKENT
jgi:hypothetical protein